MCRKSLVKWRHEYVLILILLFFCLLSTALNLYKENLWTCIIHDCKIFIVIKGPTFGPSSLSVTVDDNLNSLIMYLTTSIEASLLIFELWHALVLNFCVLV